MIDHFELMEDVETDILAECFRIEKNSRDYMRLLCEVLARHGLTREEAYAHYSAALTADDCNAEPIDTQQFYWLYYQPAEIDVGKEPLPKPTILIRPPECDVVDKATRSLRGAANTYQHGNALSRIAIGEQGPHIQILSDAALCELLSKQATYTAPKPTKKDPFRTVESFIPDKIVRMVAARYRWKVPRLQALVESPVLLPGGEILDQKGFDASSGLFLTRQYDLEPMTLEGAKEAIDYLIADFPFASENDKAGYVAALLTPFARHAFQGPTPIFLIQANMAGSGKTLLANLVSLTFSGRDVLTKAAPDSDAEWRKTITAIVAEGSQVVLIDNVASGETLQSASLDAALTGTTWQDRILGKSEMIQAPILWTPIATGNNIQLTSEMLRRTQPVRLLSTVERPQERNDFNEGDLRQFALDNREQLISAVLTILQSYCKAGRPDQGLPAYGSFQNWSDLVRNAVVYAGWADPYLARECLQESDPEAAQLKLLAAGWNEADPESVGLKVSKAIELATQFPLLKDALETVPYEGRALRLGKLMNRFQERPIDGRKFVAVATSGGVKVWALKPI
ncbi:hypothetical protein [Botrimarina mediterranea]|uniref:Uncharacterized protein n=1 Tax=Botrimarina mediterranea TaxID=2528022 RepID=A0A518K5J4_9BACT|nr:hypothetical protein [Botrimarina mediterranea]QDV73069.1 hypothetical protein Spa11_12580 [Botrimarina mediterranea]